MSSKTLLATAAAAMSLTSPTLAQDAEVKEGTSYFIGHNSGKQMLSQGLDIDLEKFLEGMTDALEGRDSKISEAEAQSLFQRLQEFQAAAQSAEGLAYLEENGAKDGVVTTESGLQYRVLTKGDGTTKPAATDSVTVHYEGKLIDGKIFDSSVARGEPATFGLNQVIPGWTEGVQLMTTGDKFEFTIPYQLAYGANGAGGDIPGFATLVFEVELISIN